MTNKEAYEILEKYIRCSNNECPPVDCDECQDHVTAKQLDDALQMALKALKEPEKPDHIAEVSKKDGENGDDLIRREDALMSLTGEWTESRDEILSKAIRRIKRLPSAQPEQQWIPCSERLPEYWKRVLVCFKAGRKCPHEQIQVGYFGTHEVEDEWFEKIGNVTVLYTDKYYYPLDNVTAWMPLPYPYKPQQEDNT